MARAVSYTHLDVYKRQVNGTPTVITVDREYSDVLPSLNLVAEITPDFPVSYTHLDVYKRQPCGHGPLRRG